MFRSVLFIIATLPTIALAQSDRPATPADLIKVCGGLCGGLDGMATANAAAALNAANAAKTLATTANTNATLAQTQAAAAQSAANTLNTSLASQVTKEVADVAAANAKESSDNLVQATAISKLLPVSLSNSGIFTAIAPNGTSWTFQGTAVSANANVLAADGTVVATINGSTFAWANQPTNSTVSGGDSGGTTNELDITTPPASASNQAALVAKMLSSGSALAPACYSVLMYITDPSGQNYTSGMVLHGAAQDAIFYNGNASAGGSTLGMDSETDFQHSNAAAVFGNSGQAYYTGYPISQQYYQRICTDGTNYSVYTSQTGAAGSFGQPYVTATLASLGNPTDIGFYEAANYSSSSAPSYNGVGHLVSFAIQLGNNPQAAAPTVVQTFANALTSIVYPSVSDPVDSTAVPQGWPTSDQANLQNYASFVFGSANTMSPNCSACLITNRTQLDSHFEHNQLDGNAYAMIDTGPKDGYGNSALGNVYRSYPVGDPHDTTVVNSDALQLKAFCAGMNGTVCQGKGNVVSGIIRPETVVQDDTVVEACMIRPNTQAAWLTYWEEGGSYPPAGTTPQFYGSSIYPTRTTYYLENDGPDGYPINDGTAANFNLTPNLPTLNDSANASRQSISGVYFANGGPFTHISGGFNTSYDQSAAMHCYQWENVPATFSDAAHTVVTKPGHVIWSVDGVEYQDDQTNWEGGPQTDWAGNALPGNPDSMLSVMLGLQYAATFTPKADAQMTPANVAGAVAKVYSLRFWRRTGGAHAAPTLPAG